MNKHLHIPVPLAACLLLLLLFDCEEMHAQRYVGFLDLDYSRIDYDNKKADHPKLIYPCFVDSSGTWREYRTADLLQACYQKKFRLYHEGKYIQHIYVSPNLNKEGPADALAVSQFQLRTIGKPSTAYHKFAGITSTPPLLAINASIHPYSKSSATGITPPVLKQELAAFLAGWAYELKLGAFQPGNIPAVDSISAVWFQNDSLTLVEATVNLHIYCLTDTVPFADINNHNWRTLEKIPTYRKPELANGPAAIAENAGLLTDHCVFLRYNGKWFYIDRLLDMMTIADLDEDGTPEILFRKQGNSYISYILLTNKFQSKIEHRIIQWW